jgi:hypothetical protein
MHPRLALLLVTLVGCGPGTTGPATYPVTGVVTLAGAPVENAIVQFTPVSPDAGIAGAQASTRSDGRFDVRIELEMGKSSKPGLPTGEYKVAVTKFESPPGQASLDKPPQNVLPSKYATIDASPLTVTVKDDGENYFELPL